MTRIEEGERRIDDLHKHLNDMARERNEALEKCEHLRKKLEANER